ncbi:MAG: DUF1080 domain-containing protein [Verrucomicrobiae bacterium]|nr:DUF1080 domain-containing protein [Verrucomicrobiae bacterium]NNJ86890.1 DUF1080 domain-containing protein [Akkermansiaceae bacterium]
MIQLSRTLFTLLLCLTATLADPLKSQFEPQANWNYFGEIGHSGRDLTVIRQGESIVANISTTGKLQKGDFLRTKEKFQDVHMKMEFMVPKGSNSGVYFMGRYEVQILDSFGRKRFGSGDLGGIYQRWAQNREPKGFEGVPPKVNAAKAPGEWQTMEVVFRAPRFTKEGKKSHHAKFVKVLINGVAVHENQLVKGPTRSSKFNDETGSPAAIYIQGDHGPVAIRKMELKKIQLGTEGEKPLAATQGKSHPVAGATESTPSYSQYFSWINNTNEGSTEEQTLTNLAFFKWLHDEYGMKLDIYAFDAGNIDGPKYYGSTKTEKFKKQFPRGFKPIYEYAKSFDCRLGVWLGPDGFGDTPEEEQERIDMLVGFCRDYEFALFKMDAVCTQLRPEKQQAFDRLMTEVRKHSPNLILLNHRLNLGPAKKHATTFLWGGAETYIDVHMANRDRTGTHNRVKAISRGMVPDLKRLTEDHGVCISSCLDFWDDDLILQAFNRNLILAPEIYANPWFLRDDEFPKLARIYNLHRRYRDIMVNGVVLDEQRYGPLAASRGDDTTRLITLRNLTWEPVTRKVKLDDSIGFKADGAVEVRQFHPSERILGTFSPGDEVEVTVQPFRSCLLLVGTKGTGGVGITGSDYEVVRDVPGKDVVINVLGGAGETAKISLVTGGTKFSDASLDSQSETSLLTGQSIDITFPGQNDRKSWHRRVGAPKVTDVPADAEMIFETACFTVDNDPLEIRSLRRSGPTRIPQVQKARQAFLDQKIIEERGILQDYLFDNKPTVYDFERKRVRAPQSRMLRIDLGKVTGVDSFLLEAALGAYAVNPVVDQKQYVQVSADLKSWSMARLVQDGNNMRIECDPSKPIRYLRTNIRPGKLVEIRGYAKANGGGELDRSGWRMNWMFPPYQPASKAWSLPFSLKDAPEGGYLTVACNGKHGVQGVWVGMRIDGKYIGAPDRAPSFKANPWEYPVRKSDQNYSFFIPVTPDMVGKKCEIVVLALDSENIDFTPDVWQTSYPTPYVKKTLVLKR